MSNTHPDLFGGETPIVKSNGEFKSKLESMVVRKAGRFDPKCKNCTHFIRKGFHNKTYFKCALIGDTSSSATDIQAGYTCKKFTPKESIE